MLREHNIENLSFFLRFECTPNQLMLKHNSNNTNSRTGKTTETSSATQFSGFDCIPSVIAGFQDCSDEWATVRYESVSKSEIKWNIEGDAGSATLGYIAFETSTTETSEYLASSTEDIVDHDEYTLVYAYPFDDVPLFFGIVGTDGGDDCSVHLKSPTSENTDLYLAEAYWHDGPHTEEVVYYVAMEDGTKIYTEGYVRDLVFRVREARECHLHHTL